jgi:hypothetical protein
MCTRSILLLLATIYVLPRKYIHTHKLDLLDRRSYFYVIATMGGCQGGPTNPVHDLLILVLTGYTHDFESEKSM